MHLVALDGSPTGAGRTARAIEAVVAGAMAAAAGLTHEVVTLAEAGTAAGLEALRRADAVVLGSPVYRASYAHPLKVLLDATPRGMWGETEDLLGGRAVATVLTGASLHHFLGADDLRAVLAGFFASWVVPPGCYVPREGFDDDAPHPGLAEPYASHAASQGAALVALASALAGDARLAAPRPQA